MSSWPVLKALSHEENLVVARLVGERRVAVSGEGITKGFAGSRRKRIVSVEVVKIPMIVVVFVFGCVCLRNEEFRLSLTMAD